MKALVLTFVLLSTVACKPHADSAAPSGGVARPGSAALSQPAAPLAPPTKPFVAPLPWQSHKPGTPPVPAPDIAQQTWRGFVNQNQPNQIKTPLWQPLLANQTVELAMPAGSTFRCVVSALEIVPETNDFGTKLLGWTLSRSLLCSIDRWRSWTEYPHTLHLDAEGNPKVLHEAHALLRERGDSPEVRHTFVIVRHDKENLAATTGPPRILPGVQVDEE